MDPGNQDADNELDDDLDVHFDDGMISDSSSDEEENNDDEVDILSLTDDSDSYTTASTSSDMDNDDEHCDREDVTPMLEFIPLKPPTLCSVPAPRSGHRIIVYNGQMYSLGGYNPDYNAFQNTEDTNYPLFWELWKFNLATARWQLMKKTIGMPKELASHAAILLGRNLLVMGGTGIPFGQASSSDVHICNLTTLKWRQFVCSQEVPMPAYGHSMCTHGEYLYVFGGTSGWQYTSEVHRLNLTTHEWELLEAQGDSVPDGRYRHEIAIYDNKIYVFGGGRSYISYGFQKLPVFHIDTKTWEKAPCQPCDPHGFPKPRRCHSCVQYKGNVYMCGGYNGNFIYGDIWRLHLPSLTWQKLMTIMPEPAYFHGAAVTEAGCMVIFGGVTRIDTQRTSRVYAMWLDIPSLKQLSWLRILRRIPDLHRVSKERMYELGVPRDLIAQMD